MALNNDPVGSNVIYRPQGRMNAAYWVLQSIGAPPVPHGGVIYQGRVAWAFTSSSVGPSGMQSGPNFGGINRPLVCCFQETRSPANIDGLDDFACWSFSAILAFDQLLGPAIGDLGLVLGSSNRSAPRNPAFAQSGMEIGPTNTGQVGVFVRQLDAGPATFSQATPFQPDITKFHKYEIRLISASDTREAQAKFLIDDQLQFALPYGAGTVLPGQFESGSVGIEPTITNRAVLAGTTRMYIAMNGITVAAAPTEAALA